MPLNKDGLYIPPQFKSKPTSIVKRETQIVKARGPIKNPDRLLPAPKKFDPFEYLRETLKPLCPETEQLLRPINGLQKNDRLALRLTESGNLFHAEIYADVKGQKRYPSYAAAGFFNRIPEKKRLRVGTVGEAMHLAATDFTCLVTNACWPIEQIEFHDEFTRMKYAYLLARFLHQTQRAQAKAAFKMNNVLPPQIENFQDHPELKLNDYQKAAAWTSYGMECAGLFMEQGTGKTPVVISRVCHEAKAHIKKDGAKCFKVLILAPKNVRSNWVNEFKRFSTTPGKISVLRGGPVERVMVLTDVYREPENLEKCNWSVCVSSYDSVVRTWDAFCILKWDLIVLDESHYIKSSATKRWKYVSKLRNLSNKRMILSGTPIANSLFDIYTQLEFLDEGMSGFSSFEAFKSFYGSWDKTTGNLGFHKLVGYQNLPLLKERLSRLAFIIDKKTALPDLPPQMFDIKEVGLSKQQAKMYSELQAMLEIELSDELDRMKDGTSTITINHVLTQLLKLAQVTSGFVKTDRVIDEDTGRLVQDGQTIHFDDVPKIDETVQLIEEKTEYEKVIVWTCFTANIEALSRALNKKGIDHVIYKGGMKDSDLENAKHRFNNDRNCKVFIGNAKAGGTGLNLIGWNPDGDPNSPDNQCNTTHVIYFSTNWSMIDYTQSSERAHRLTTRVPIRYTHMIVPNSIDDEIYERLQNKKYNAKNLQDLRGIMKRILKTIVPVNGD